MASYLTPPNLRALQSTPVQSLNQQVMSTIGARSQYYVQSLAQIKNNYDNTFDFNLSNETNANSLSAQRVEAEEKLKSAVKKDLSIGTNATETMNIFKPIMQNRNYILDEQLTNKIQSGFQAAQSDLKTKGSDHYNMKSLQVMGETLADWKKEDPSNIQVYLNDTLGTTYQPYDPKVDKEFTKTIQDRVKAGKIKIDVKDGQGNIITQEMADLNSMQAQEYIKEIRPQQSIVQDQLEARLYSNRLRKADPQERDQLLNSVQGIQKYNIDKQISSIDAEKHKLELNYHSRPAEEQEASKKDYETAIERYKDGVKKAKNMYADFDQDAYFNPNKKNLAQNQLETLLIGKSVNALVDGMGLESNSRTVKSDVSFWNGKNLAFNIQKHSDEMEYKRDKLKLDAAKLALKAKGTGSEEGGENPLVTSASNLSDIGTSGMNEEDKQIATGKELQNQLKGGIEAKECENISSVLGKLKITVKDDTGFSNIDVFSAIDKELMKDGHQNVKFSDILDRVSGGNEKNKSFIRTLLQEGSFKMNNGRGFSLGKQDAMGLQQARTYIKAAMTDPRLFNEIVKKAGIDTGDFNAADAIGHAQSTIDYEKKTEEGKFGKAYKTATAALGLGVEKLPYESQKHFSEDAYVEALKPELQRNGIDPSRLKNYLKNQDVTTNEIKHWEDVLKRADPQERVAIQAHLSDLKRNIDNSLKPYKQRWDSYQTTLNKNLAAVSKGATNYNTIDYRIDPKNTPDDKTFDPNIDFNFTTFKQLINNNITSATVGGVTTDGKAADKIKRLVREYPNVVTGFSVYSDGKDQFIIPSVSRNKENDKALSDVGLDAQEFTNTKIYLDKTTLPTLRIKPQSKTANELAKGKIFGSKLPSGSEVTWYNSGNGSDLDVQYEGSFAMTAMEPTTGVFNIKKPTFSNYIRAKGLQPATIEAAEEVGRHTYSLDADAVRVMGILSKHNIDFKGEKNIIWGNLPKEVKEELKRNTLQFKNQRD